MIDRILRDSRAWGVMLAATLTIMSNATITPALPGIQAMFPDNPNAELLTRLLITAPSLVVAIIAPFAGVMVDRLGRRLPLFTGLGIYLLAGTAGLYLQSLEAILASRLALGLGVAGIMTAQAALIGDYFTGPERGRLMGYQLAAVNLGGLIFVMTAGFLAAISPRLPFLIYGLALPIFPLLWRLLPEPDRSAEQNPGTAMPGGGGEPGWPVTVLIMATAAALTFVVFYAIPTQLPYHLAEIGLEDPRYAGEVMASMMLAAAVSAVISGLVRPLLGRIGTPVTGFLLLSGGFWILAQATALPLAMAGTALIGSGLGFCMPTFITTALNAAPFNRRGLVSGLVTSSFFLGQFLSPVASQPLVAQWGYPAAFTTGSLLFLGLSVILAVTLKHRQPHVDNTARAQ
ncbi:Predicted arabinose efflux permease, MFS family [Paracoccus isoporae]|uniref:Predicted arabinose efflux permease, MFS family n=1 Tax=Paracoccus isoporae TaxID=591205 RepID=A0A1G6UP86_9RHOB|nr:MFS transporter [Paracoccus isoporae]SDD43240.1 Predicted arabinose efflux permease, MFS family [Paracoccus isoporae]